MRNVEEQIRDAREQIRNFKAESLLGGKVERLDFFRRATCAESFWLTVHAGRSRKSRVTESRMHFYFSPNHAGENSRGGKSRVEANT